MDITVNILLTIATAATPLLVAAIGELVVERSGVLNLGVEGMMIMGAVAGFGIGYLSGSPWIGLIAAVIVGALFSLLFAVMTLSFATNQVATGLSLTLLGLGLPGERLPNLYIPLLSDLPVVGKLLFGQDPVFYLSIALTAGVAWFLFRTRAGLTLRSIGDSHTSAHALGIKVIRYRYLAVIFGGACAGLAGGQLSLVYTPQWVENMSAGRGWIALALVVFAAWRPFRLLGGAYFFGLMMIFEVYAKSNVAFRVLPSEFWAALPYIATVLVLVLISLGQRGKSSAPACLGKPFLANG